MAKKKTQKVKKMGTPQGQHEHMQGKPMTQAQMKQKKMMMS